MRISGRSHWCLALIGLLVVPRPVGAWGNDGHVIICQIALARLTSQGNALVTAIAADLNQVRDPFDTCPACNNHQDDGRLLSFQDGCTWADEARRDTFKGTYEYHFINVPRAASGLELPRDCAALDCVVVAVQRYARYLALMPGTSPRERERRVLALRFLGHFVGDLHQPLHVGHAEDQGGNLLHVKWNTGTGLADADLHRVWDTLIMKRAGIQSLADGMALNAEISASELAEWQTFDVRAWADESFADARSHAYADPDGNAVTNGSLLSDTYFNAVRPVVIQRLKQAGVRLAHLINAAAAGTLPLNLVDLSAP